MAKRLLFIDLLRILAVTLVILVHNTRLPHIVELVSLPSFIVYAFAKICVPLFVMVSGALLLGKRESYVSFFQKRATRIILPWLVWSVIFFLLDRNYSLFTTIMTRYWFMPLIVGLYLLTPALRIFATKAKSRDLYYVVVVWFLGIILLPYIYPSITFSVGMQGSIIMQLIQYVGYFLLGYLLMRTPLKRVRIFSYIAVLIGVSGPAIFTQTTPPSDPEYLKYFDFVSPFIVLTASGIFLLLKEKFGKMENSSVLLRAIADASFGMIFVHEFFNLFFWHNDQNPLAFMSNFTFVGFDFIRACIPLVLSLGVVMVLRRISFLRNIIV